MGAKATFNSITRIIKLTEAPTLIDGEQVVELDVKIDLYGDQKEDWLANPTTLRKVRPPFSVIGGQTTPTGSAGNTFFQRSDWKIEPYDASHILRISGNLYSDDGKSPFIVPSGGTYMVQIERVVSNIVDTVTFTTGSAVTAQDKTDIITGVTSSTIITATRNMTYDVWQFGGCDPAFPTAISGDGETTSVIDVNGKKLTITPTGVTHT